MYTGRAVFGAHAAQLDDRAACHGEVRNPDVIVAVNHYRPRTGKAATLEWRARIRRTVRPKDRYAAAVHGAALLLRHGFRQVIRGLLNPLGFEAHSHVSHVGHAQHARAEPVCDPDVSLAVDVQAAVVDSGIKVLGLAWVRGGKARDVGKAAIGNPDAVLLVDGEVKGRHERFAWLRAITLAYDPSLGYLTLGKVD